MDFCLITSASFRVFRSSAHMAVTGIFSALDTWGVADIKWNNQLQLSLINEFLRWWGVSILVDDQAR